MHFPAGMRRLMAGRGLRLKVRGLKRRGESRVAQVRLCKADAVYLDGGIYGRVNEEQSGHHRKLRMVATRSCAPARIPSTVDGPASEPPDIFHDTGELPEDIREADGVEFGGVGAYGVSCRRAFNGFFPDRCVADPFSG